MARVSDVIPWLYFTAIPAVRSVKVHTQRVTEFVMGNIVKGFEEKKMNSADKDSGDKQVNSLLDHLYPSLR